MKPFCNEVKAHSKQKDNQGVNQEFRVSFWTKKKKNFAVP